jgi:hypothetical protein
MDTINKEIIHAIYGNNHNLLHTLCNDYLFKEPNWWDEYKCGKNHLTDTRVKLVKELIYKKLEKSNIGNMTLKEITRIFRYLIEEKLYTENDNYMLLTSYTEAYTKKDYVYLVEEYKKVFIHYTLYNRAINDLELDIDSIAPVALKNK